MTSVAFSKRRAASMAGRKMLQQATTLGAVFYRDLRVNLLGQRFPIRPETLNLLVNDVCNSRCHMCCVWRQRRGEELTPHELSRILGDPLFRNLRYVGVSGGEPTLREDLPDIYSVLVHKRPAIRGTGIITNALRREQVLARILASATVCRETGTPFNVMVSLDGIGEVHDRIRGREGNFESAVEVIRYLSHNTDIPVSIGCTITKENLWYVDDVLDFCRQEQVYGRFRVAEFIRRLHNEQQTEYIRSFTELEAYHLGLFFAKLEQTYEKSPKVARTYRSIRRMLLEDAQRSIPCPWQSIAVTLDSSGQLLYCAPRSRELGDCLEHSAEQLYRDSIQERRRIIARDCANCIHDYHAEPTTREVLSSMQSDRWHQRLSLDRAFRRANTRLPSRLPIADGRTPREFLITGWYGTETAGDKATLGEILHRLRNEHGNCTIVLASLYPYVSRWTVRELGYPDVIVIPVYSRAFWHHTAQADEVIMGGGPLMHLEVLGVVLWAFLRAKQSGHRTRIAGCGIGPLDRGKRYVDAVRSILLLADVVELRDSASVAWAKEMTARDDIEYTSDPAADFVRRWMEESPDPDSTAFLNLYLRDLTNEYQGDRTITEFSETKARFEYQLGLWIHEICARFGLRPQLLPMHHFCIGNDDRDFNRRFAQTHLSDLDPIVERVPVSVYDLLESMRSAAFSLCMRFHSVLFADTLGAPYLAIDYTCGGKIEGYLQDHQGLGKMIALEDVADGAWCQTGTRIQARTQST